MALLKFPLYIKFPINQGLCKYLNNKKMSINYKCPHCKGFLSINDYGEDHKIFDIPDESYRPDVMTDSGIKDELIQKALLKVKEDFREVVILRDIDGMSYEEIAEITGLNEGTVKSRINRGRAKLQELLKDIYKE